MADDIADDNIEVHDEPAKHRYEIEVAGELAGFARYTPGDDLTDFTHTEIADRFEGRGLASRLIRAALDDSRAHGRQVRPTCPFVRGFIAKHPDYVDLVPAGERERFDLSG